MEIIARPIQKGDQGDRREREGRREGDRRETRLAKVRALRCMISW